MATITKIRFESIKICLTAHELLFSNEVSEVNLNEYKRIWI